MKRYELEAKEKWDKIITNIPTLKFNSDWEVRIIPPYGGAIARFYIEKNNKHICSVYLDWYDTLGYVGDPYYELYPFETDTKRYLLNETDELLKDIERLFNES